MAQVLAEIDSSDSQAWVEPVNRECMQLEVRGGGLSSTWRNWGCAVGRCGQREAKRQAAQDPGLTLHPLLHERCLTKTHPSLERLSY